MGRYVIIDESQDTIPCPRCGVTIIDDSVKSEPKPPCEHVRFIYANYLGFAYAAPEITREYNDAKRLAKTAGTVLNLHKFFEGAMEDGGLIISRTEFTFADGPEAYTVLVGIL